MAAGKIGTRDFSSKRTGRFLFWMRESVEVGVSERSGRRAVFDAINLHYFVFLQSRLPSICAGSSRIAFSEFEFAGSSRHFERAIKPTTCAWIAFFDQGDAWAVGKNSRLKNAWNKKSCLMHHATHKFRASFASVKKSSFFYPWGFAFREASNKSLPLNLSGNRSQPSL